MGPLQEPEILWGGRASSYISNSIVQMSPSLPSVMLPVVIGAFLP